MGNTVRCYRATWPGRDRTQMMASSNRNRRRDPRLGGPRQGPGLLDPLSPPPHLPMNKEKEAQHLPPRALTLRTPHPLTPAHTPIHHLVGPAHAVGNIRHGRSHHQALPCGKGAESALENRQEREGREKGLDAPIMPA